MENLVQILCPPSAPIPTEGKALADPTEERKMGASQNPAPIGNKRTEAEKKREKKKRKAANKKRRRAQEKLQAARKEEGPPSRRMELPNKEKKPQGEGKPKKEKGVGRTPGQRREERGETWSKVIGRGEKNKAKQELKRKEAAPRQQASGPRWGGPKVVGVVPKPPKSAAVTITCPEGSYKDFMTEARRRINPEELGIPGVLRIRAARTGALLIEVLGLGSGPSADRLAEELGKLAAEKCPDYRVQRLVKIASVRITDLDATVGAEEVAAAMAKAGGCLPAEVSVGRYNLTQRGLASTVVRCPLAAASKAAATGRVRIGWTRVGVMVLPAGAEFCFKCLEQGHMRGRCGNAVDRSDACYRCGNPGHHAKECEAVAAHCPVARDWEGKPTTRGGEAPARKKETRGDGGGDTNGGVWRGGDLDVELVAIPGGSELEGTQVGTPHTASEEAIELAVFAEASVLEATTADAPSGEAEAASSRERRRSVWRRREGLAFTHPPDSLRVSQANLGRGARAQDLWIHRLAELGAGLGVVTEPHFIPVGNPNWLGSKCGLAAVVACPAAVAGDFNAHWEEWGCSLRQRDPRGNVVADWAAGLGLVLMNTGSSAPVCGRGEASQLLT
ncbi:uncharacterized protein LOC112590577 [Harpegnathos saltator]|uniref:uncharacterized protein LOC112590577 n=1 Tax=Harpegnathos saltator TaxID=610380 RepID=UPI000DBEDB1A|nr:uncharacterized protein LOC112590577 [Harpegnathos saltator]